MHFNDAFPTLFLFSIWGARNIAIFQNKWVTLDVICVVLVEKLQEHKIIPSTSKRRVVVAPDINKNLPWAYFDGANQGKDPCGGDGGVINLPSNMKLCIKYAIG